MYRIYLITNHANGKVYVGQTKKTLDQRFAAHVKSSTTAETYLARAINKHGADKFTIQLVDTVDSKAAANAAEIHHIARLSSNSAINGYNLTIGGDGGDTFSCQTPERKKVIRNLARARVAESKPWESKWSTAGAGEQHSQIMVDYHASNKAQGIISNAVAAMNTRAVIEKRTKSIIEAFSNPETLAKRNAAIKAALNKPEAKARASANSQGAKNSNSRETIINGMVFKTRKDAAKHFGLSSDQVLKLHKQSLELRLTRQADGNQNNNKGE